MSFNGRRHSDDGLEVTWHVREEGQESSRVECRYKFGKDWYSDIGGQMDSPVGEDIGSEAFGNIVSECARQADVKREELRAIAEVNHTASKATGRVLGETQGIVAVLKHLAGRSDVGSPEFVRIYRELDSRFGVLNDAKVLADEATSAVMDGEARQFLESARVPDEEPKEEA